MSLADRIIAIIEEYGFEYKDKSRAIYTECPLCGRADKFSILKANGACICYRGSCEFGKRWFEDWIMLVGNVTRIEAKRRLYGEVDQKRFQEAADDPDSMFKGFHEQEEETVATTIPPIQFPEYHMIKITSAEATEAVEYLQRRGVSLEMAAKHNIHYSPMLRRVILPITMNGKVYGWQGRHIDPVADEMRMRNNVGFRREVLVMFADELSNNKHAIICEGPFDALKFDKVGGYVATMGKFVSDKQLATILSYGPQKIYLALDDDAAKELREMKYRVGDIPVFRISVPDSCVQRCELVGKKPDFGECTLEECELAFRAATVVDETYLPIYFDKEKA